MSKAEQMPKPSGPPFTRPNGIAYRSTPNGKVRVWCHICWGMRAPLRRRELVADIDSAYAWWIEHEVTDLHCEHRATRDAIVRISEGLK